MSITPTKKPVETQRTSTACAFSAAISALSLQVALQPGKMSLFCALAEWFYTVGALLQ